VLTAALVDAELGQARPAGGLTAAQLRGLLQELQVMPTLGRTARVRLGLAAMEVVEQARQALPTADTNSSLDPHSKQACKTASLSCCDFDKGVISLVRCG